MSNNLSDDSLDPSIEAPPSSPDWMSCTAEDLAAANLESYISDCNSADANAISDVLNKAEEQRRVGSSDQDQAASRALRMLSQLMGMQARPEDRADPFAPQAVLPDGRRSAIVSDFSECIPALEVVARLASHPVVKARASDVCWTLDRSKAAMSQTAITSYLEVIKKVRSGELTYRFDLELQELHYDTCQTLRRALTICRSIGWEKEAPHLTRGLAVELRESALSAKNVWASIRFSDLDLDFRISATDAVAREIERLTEIGEVAADPHQFVELLRVATRGYHLAKMQEEATRCQVNASERLEAHSKSYSGSAMMEAHFLLNAIAQLSGVPNQRDRRAKLKHKLIDVQSRISEELAVQTFELDISDLVEETKDRMASLGLLDMLLCFAALSSIPKKADLEASAIKAIADHPLSSIFSTAHMDREGKTISRTDGGGPGIENPSSRFNQIASAESHRRAVVASGAIEPARQVIIGHHYLSEDFLARILACSPFIEPGQLLTYTRGFGRMFQGDYISATYTLIPLLENSIRYVLKNSGHDPTKLDDVSGTQEDLTISNIFEQMREEVEGALTSDLAFGIDILFLAKPGPHLRHAVAHVRGPPT